MQIKKFKSIFLEQAGFIQNIIERKMIPIRFWSRNIIATQTACKTVILGKIFQEKLFMNLHRLQAHHPI